MEKYGNNEGKDIYMTKLKVARGEVEENSKKLENEEFNKRNSKNSEDNKPNESLNLEQEHGEIKNITILIEGQETLSYENKDGKITTVPFKQIEEEKKYMFKRLEIMDICKENTSNILQRINLYRKVNPAIVTVLKNDKESIKQYIKDLKNKEEFKFDLTHDLSRLNVFQKLKERKYTRTEEKCNAQILRKIFNKNKALAEPKEGKKSKKNTSTQAHKDFIKTLQLIVDDIREQDANYLRGKVNKEIVSGNNNKDKYSGMENTDYMKSLEGDFYKAINDRQDTQDNTK